MLPHHTTVCIDPYGYQWEMRFDKMKEFLEEHGCFPYDIEFDELDEEGKRALDWANRQKKNYRIYRSGETYTTMTEERISKLEGIGFSWNKHDDSWMQRYRDLVKYYEHHGHSMVPKTYPANAQLPQWVSQQRTQYRLLEKGNKLYFRNARAILRHLF